MKHQNIESMNKIYALLLLSFCMMLSSCKLHTSHNGDLDGLWQVMVKENLATEETVDMRDYHSTWSVQGDLLIMQMDGSPSIIFRFSHKDGTLLIYDPYISGRFGESATDVKLEDANVLVPYGLSALEEYLKVIKLDSDDMILESSTSRLVFRKY